MSWFSRPTFSTNAELVNYLIKQKVISHKSVINAMKSVDRKHFTPSGGDPYNDSPQTLGHGATISAPHMHGHALEYLESRLKPGMTVLDVGSGSGILCAYMAHMVIKTDAKKIENSQSQNENTKINSNSNSNCNNKDETDSKTKDCNINNNNDNSSNGNGKVVGIEHIQSLVDTSIKNLEKNELHKSWLADGSIDIMQGDGRLGYPKYAPFDCIHVGAAAQPNVVNTLFDQLADGGILVIPVETDAIMQEQMFRIYTKNSKYLIDKASNKYDIDKCKQDLLPVMYVPLTDKKTQQRRNQYM